MKNDQLYLYETPERFSGIQKAKLNEVMVFIFKALWSISTRKSKL